MRGFLLVANLLLFISWLISQNLNVAEHQLVDITGEMVSIHSKIFYLKSVKGTCCSSTMQVVCAEDSGKTLFKSVFDIYSINNFGRLIKTRDNALFLNGHSTKWCDRPKPTLLKKFIRN